MWSDNDGVAGDPPETYQELCKVGLCQKDQISDIPAVN